MKVSDLFKRYNVPFPDWVTDDMLIDEFEDAEYSIEEGSHKWVLSLPWRSDVILFSAKDEEYSYVVTDSDDVVLLEMLVTPEFHYTS